MMSNYLDSLSTASTQLAASPNSHRLERSVPNVNLEFTFPRRTPRTFGFSPGEIGSSNVDQLVMLQECIEKSKGILCFVRRLGVGGRTVAVDCWPASYKVTLFALLHGNIHFM